VNVFLVQAYPNHPGKGPLNGLLLLMLYVNIKTTEMLIKGLLHTAFFDKECVRKYTMVLAVIRSDSGKNVAHTGASAEGVLEHL